MNVPFVKVNNQQEFDRVVEKMERETGFKLYEGTTLSNIYNVVGIDDDNDITLFNLFNPQNKHLKFISADEYLTGTRTSFTLDDLEDGMVVELRNSSEKFYISLNRSFVGNKEFLSQDTYNDKLLNENYSKYDIIKVYKPKGIYSLKGTFKEFNLTLIFDAEAHRIKLSNEQKKAEVQSQIDTLKQQLEELNGN